MNCEDASSFVNRFSGLCKAKMGLESLAWFDLRLVENKRGESCLSLVGETSWLAGFCPEPVLVAAT